MESIVTPLFSTKIQKMGFEMEVFQDGSGTLTGLA